MLVHYLTGILNVKDSLLEKFLHLTTKQDEFSQKQDEFSQKQDEFKNLQNETHKEVVDVKKNMHVMKGTIDNIQSSLYLNERISMHNAKGVRLVSKAVSSLIPQEVELVKEMKQYEIDRYELTNQQNHHSRPSSSNQNFSSTYELYGKTDPLPFNAPYINNKDNSSNGFPISHHEYQVISPEREIEIPMSHQSSYVAASRNILPVSMMERKGDRVEEDVAFDDIRKMALIGMTKNAVGTPHGRC